MKLKGVAAFAAALLASTIAITPATATTTITVSGNFGGVFNGQPFESQQTTFIGRGEDATEGDGFLVLNLTSLIAQSSFGGMLTTLSFTDTDLVYIISAELAAFGRLNGGALFGYSPVASNGTVIVFSDPTGGDPLPNATFSTDRGSIQITSGTDISTTAAVVPEPATWAMMLVGFAMVGAASRYRRRIAKVTFA